MKISDSPPQKRRRCAETAGLIPAQPVTDPTTNPDTQALSSYQIAGEPILDGSKPGSSSNFDPKVFTAFTGEELSPDILKRLEDVSGGDMERAINMQVRF
jgi:DNA repair protein RAD5